MRLAVVCCSLIFFSQGVLFPQSSYVLDVLPEVTNAHLRGLCVTPEGVVWASGTEGTVLRSTDNGLHWDVIRIPGAESLDFRDVEAWSDREAIVMSSGKGVRLYRTEDGAKSWTLVYEENDTNVFMDGMALKGDKGIALGDPIKGRWQVLQTEDRGRTWKRNAIQLPMAFPKEAAFAASGTSIAWSETGIFAATGGGQTTRVFRSEDDGQHWKATTLPMTAGEAAGIFGLCFRDPYLIIAVGGNYTKADNRDGTSAITFDAGEHWIPSKVPPTGYRSSATCVNSSLVCFATGTNGTDVSYSGGFTWERLSDEGFNSCVNVNGRTWLVGNKGRIGVITVKDR